MLYLCIVMTYYSIKEVPPALKECRKFVKRLNERMSCTDIGITKRNYKVIGTPKISFITKDGVVVTKVTFKIKEGYVKFYGREDFTNVSKGDQYSRKVSSRIKDEVKSEIYKMYLRHLGFSRYGHGWELSMSWV